MPYTNLVGESAEYLAARDALRVAEAELVDHVERVALLRRSLPTGPTVGEYELVEGPRRLDDGDEPSPVALRELFTEASRPLVVYHLMYGKAQTTPCPMCTMWVDGFNGIARHVRERTDLVVVAAAPIEALRAHARARCWDELRLVSAGTSTFKLDLGSEDAQGNQGSQVSVFTKDGDGSVRHVYSASPQLSEERHERGIDLLCPTWHLFDLTPAGRGEWYASLSND